MPVKGKRDLAKEKFWRSTLDRFTESGKSRAQFCKDENLKPDLFVYWQKVIKARDADARKSKHNPRQGQTDVFAEVSVKPATRPTETGRRRVVAEAVFSGGSLLVFENADLALMRHLIQALKETSP